MNKQTITTYEGAVEYLFSIPRFTGKNSIEDTQAFLHRLKDPDRKLKIIHVAGTNGKGSVCAYLRAILEEAGLSTAVFTSPHLVDVRERFLIKGEMPSKETFLKTFLEIYELLDWEMLEQGAGYHPSFFEYLFFMAMLLFEKAQPDYVILETGLGGRLDATNSVSHKEIAVITRIGLDHVEYLGDTLTAIASEKAGIIGKETPVVFWDFDSDVSEVICRRAKELGSKAYPVSKADISLPKFQNKSIDFSLHSRYYECIALTLSTMAAYQTENVSLAVRTIEELGLADKIDADALKGGVKKCFWQGRMEEILPEVYVDGAHNGDGIRAFIETVSQDAWEGTRTLVFGVVKDKDYENMCSLLAGADLFDRMILVQVSNGRKLMAQDLMDTMKRCLGENKKIQIGVYDRIEDALKILLPNRKETERIYIAGSLYLVGEVKEVCDGLR